MALRVLRVLTAALLGASGVLMFAASWQRWADYCRWGNVDIGLCGEREDHRYDFVAPVDPWEPVGQAAELAGWSMLLVAFALALMPWALTGRRPGVFSSVALIGAVLAQAAMGVATLRSGLAGIPVEPIGSGLAVYVWLLVPPVLLGRFAVAARGWPRAAAVLLVLATPLVAGLTYAIGSYDARPWYEAMSGAFTVAAGLCLLVAAAFSSSSQTKESAATVAPPAHTGGVPPPNPQPRDAP